MSDEFANLFSLDASAAVATENNTSESQQVSSLPPLSDIGPGNFTEMRSSGNIDVNFTALSTHATKDSVIIIAVMTKAPGSCKDIRLDGGLGVFQATSQGFKPNLTHTEYESETDKRIISNGATRTINTMVLPKNDIGKAMALDKTPAAVKSAYINFEVVPQGTVDNLAAQFGAPIVQFHVNPGKKSYPKQGDTFKITDFIFPTTLPGDGDKVYHAGGALGMLPWHTISSDDLVVPGSVPPNDLLAMLNSPAFHAANMTVLKFSPGMTLMTLPAAKPQHEVVISDMTNGHVVTMAEALKPTLCEPATAGKPESRAVFMDKDPSAWAGNMGTAANDPKSCNLGRVNNMLCLTTNPSIVSVGGQTHVFNPVMETAVKAMKNELEETDSVAPIIGVSITQFAEREYADSKLAKACARNAPKIMELKMEVSITTPAIAMQAVSDGAPPGAISKMAVTASLMTNHVTGPFGVDEPKLSTAFFGIVKPVLSLTLIGNLAQNTDGQGLENDKAKETMANQRALDKRIGVTELNLVKSPANVIVHTEATFASAFPLSPEYVKQGLGMAGGGDFISESKGTIIDAIEIASAAAKANDEEDGKQWNRKSTYTKAKCFATGNLKLAKDAEWSCINQDGATDVLGTVYAFVAGHEKALSGFDATAELFGTTEFGEQTVANSLNLDGVPGELVSKVNHGVIFLFQKRFAATATGTTGAAIAVKNDCELDFSYMNMNMMSDGGVVEGDDYAEDDDCGEDNAEDDVGHPRAVAQPTAKKQKKSKK